MSILKQNILQILGTALLCFSVNFIIAQQLVLTEFNHNKGVNNIELTNCGVVVNKLKFSAKTSRAWAGFQKFEWTLYKDNDIIYNFSNGLIMDCDGNFFCDAPASFFFETDFISGVFIMELKVITYLRKCKKKGGCTFKKIITETFISNSITVTRFDDAFACKCETPDNLIVDCFGLDTIHIGISSPLGTTPKGPFEARAKNTLQANCNIASNGENVTFRAGQKITLGQGFRSGNNFRAVLDVCFDGIIRKKEDIDNPMDSVSANYSK